uniref:Uncharacterized protein n=1 Tax=Kalanchoe fedtschenkoi TaxID=63787 RepID=A0A7N0UEE1_KALFE
MASSVNVLRCPNAAAALPSSSGESKGLRRMNVFFQNENISQVSSLQRSDKGCFNKLKFGITRASSGAGEGDTQPFPNGKIVSVEHNNFVGNQSGVESRVDGIGLGTLSAQTVPTATGFPPGDDEFDLDQPSESFASIPEAVEDIRNGKMVVVH